MESNIDEEHGEAEVDLLNVREPSFFSTPWDLPSTGDRVKPERPKVLTIVTKEKLTEPQRVFIRTDATVRPNRIWKARYDSYNGKYIIDALKNTSVRIERPDDLKKVKGKSIKVADEVEGEGEGGEEQTEQKLSDQEDDFDEIEHLGEEVVEDKRTTYQKILDVLKEAQISHNEAWKLKEMQKLCKDYWEKAQAILERKRDWKMRVVKLQMYLADQVTDHLVSIQKHLVKIKEKAEDEQMMKALRRYQAEFEEALKYWNEQKANDHFEAASKEEEEQEEEDVIAEEEIQPIEEELEPDLFLAEAEIEQEFGEESVEGEAQDADTIADNLDDKFYRVVPLNELPANLKQTLSSRGNTIDGIVVTKRYLEDEPTEQELAPPPSGRDLIETSGRSISVKQELTDSRPTWLIDDHVQWDERRATQVNNDRQSEIEYSPLTFELKNSPSPGGGSQMEMLPALRPFGLSLPPLNCKKVDARGNEFHEIPLYVRVDEKRPTKRTIDTNLSRAFELVGRAPNLNPFHLAFSKSIEPTLHSRRDRHQQGPTAYHVTKKRSEIDPSFGIENGKSLQNVEHYSHDRLPFAFLYKCKGLYTTEWDAHKNHISPLVMYELPPVFRLRGKCEENPTFYGHSELGYVNFTRLLTGDSHLREKFAKVGTLRVSRGHTDFVPDLKIFDSKTREAYVSGDKNRIRTLPLTTLRVLRMDVLPCAIKNTNGWIDGHVNFRGTIANLVGKSPMRIFIENRMSAEEYQNRYKGRQWLEKRLADLYEEFLKEKAKIMDAGIEGRLLSERRDGESKECCPIFWDMIKYLQVVMEPTKNRTAEIDNGGFPSTMEQLKRLIFERILIERPEMEENSKRLESILCEWGGHSSCKADLLSIVDLIQRLTEIEALRPCWEDIKDSVINANSCPLCVLFKFMAGPGDSKMKGNMISQGDNILGKASYANREILNLEAIIEGYKNRESPPIDPALIPNEEIFHVLSTIEGCKKSKTFRFGYDKLSTRNFVMRSCGTVIFDLSRSDEEIPLAWCYLKQHMELLDRKDVRDRSDTDQMRHLILISNFLSWAKSPRSVKSKISEKTFHQRLPHPDYSEEYKLENMVYFIGQHSSKFRLYTTIVYSGIPFGEGEDVLAYIFKTAWDNELELPLFGNGKNVLPLIHINDLASVVSKTIGEREYPLMVFALNKNDKPILEQATKIAAALGSTKVVKFPSRNFQMKHCIPKIVDDLLKQDIRYNFVDTPENFGSTWSNAFSKLKKLQKLINELRETRRLFGKSVFLVGPPSKAKTELAIIISKLYNLPLIHKGNILNYFLRATREKEPMRAEEDDDNDEPDEEEKEDESEADVDEESEKKVKKLTNPIDREKKMLKLLKKLVDNKAANADRKHLTKLLQRLLQSVFVQSHGFVLVDWPVRKEDTIALFTKLLDDTTPEEDEQDEKPKRRPPARPEFTIHVGASEHRLDEENYLLFSENNLKSFEEMGRDFMEYQYYRQIHQSVVDLFEERNERMYRLNSTDGYKAVGKVLSILGEPQQDTGREMYKMFLKNEKACADDAIRIEKKALKHENSLKILYKDAINSISSMEHKPMYSLREELLGNPFEAFKDKERAAKLLTNEQGRANL